MGIVMMWSEILTAIALLLVIEGLMPALSPKQYKLFLLRVMACTQLGIRVFGFSCLILGAAIMLYVHWFYRI